MLGLGSTSVQAIGYNTSKAVPVKIDVDKDIAAYAELVRLDDPLDRGFVSACMQLKKLKFPGQYTIRQAFTDCFDQVQSL